MTPSAALALALVPAAILVPFLPAFLMATVIPALVATLFPPLQVPFLAAFLVAPVPVVAGRHAHEPTGHPAPLDPFKASLGRTGTVPAIGPAAPVPAPVEEHFLVEAFHHLDPRLDDHETRGDRQAEFDPDAHLGPGRHGTHRQKGRERDG